MKQAMTRRLSSSNGSTYSLPASALAPGSELMAASELNCDTQVDNDDVFTSETPPGKNLSFSVLHL